MTDEREEQFVERLKRESRDYNAPPPTPRDAMWARIQAARSNGEDVPRPIRIRRARWITHRVGLAAAVAALVIVSFALGRFYAPPVGVDDSVPTVASAPERAPGEKTRALYRMAAAPVLDQAEVLLTQFRQTSDDNGGAMSYSGRASALLVDTRYLLNSPAADDPEMRQLLGDLELVLAQIVRYAAGGAHEKEMVDNSMEGHQLLPRLRVSTIGSFRKVES